MRAREAHVLQALFEKREDLAPARLRNDLKLIGLDAVPDLARVARELEEIILFFEALGNGAVVGAFAVDEILLGHECLVPDAVEPFIGFLVDVAGIYELLPERLRAGPMILLIGSADELVVRDVELAKERRELADDLIEERERLLPRCVRRFDHLLGILVGTCKEIRLLAEHIAMIADDAVGERRRICVPHMELRIGIKNRRGQIKCLVVFHNGEEYQALCRDGKRPRSKSRTNSCSVAAIGTESMIPRNPANSPPTISARITKSGGTPTTRVTTSG